MLNVKHGGNDVTNGRNLNNKNFVFYMLTVYISTWMNWLETGFFC